MLIMLADRKSILFTTSSVAKRSIKSGPLDGSGIYKNKP